MSALANNNSILMIDIVVANCQIRAAIPSKEYQNMPMPTNDAGPD